MRGLTFALLVVLVVLLLVAACTTVGIEDAERRKYDAKARAEAAPIVAQAGLIEAETNATLEKLRAVTDIGKEVRAFDAQMARQEYATAILEMQALNLAIREEVEAAKRVTEELGEAGDMAYNSRAAAENSWWSLLIIPIVGTLTSLLSFAIGAGTVYKLRGKK